MFIRLTSAANDYPRWAKQFGRWLIQQGHDLWLHRNKQIYDKDNKASTMEIILNQKIRQLYTLQDEIGYHDRELFTIPMEDRLNLSPVSYTHLTLPTIA